MTDKLKNLMEKNGVQSIKKPDRLSELEAKFDDLTGTPAQGVSRLDALRIDALEAAILEIAEVMANG